MIGSRLEHELGVDVEALRARVANLERFASRLAHELSTPLVTARGFASLLLSQGGHADGVQDGLERIERAAARAERIVRHRLEAVLSSEAVPVDVAECVHDAVAQVLDAGRELLVESSLPHGDPALTAFGARATITQLLVDTFIGVGERGVGGAVQVVVVPGASDVVTLVVAADGAPLTLEDEHTVLDGTTGDRALARLAEASSLAIGLGGRLWCHGGQADAERTAVTVSLPRAVG